MLRIEKQKTEDREITTIGVDLSSSGFKTGTVAGAVVGFLYGGLPGSLIGGLLGEAAHVLREEQKGG